MANFGEVHRAQLAKSTLLTSSLVPLGSFQIFLRSVQMLKRVRCRKQWEATAPIKSLVKLQPWFLSLQWKTCLRQNYSIGFSTCSEGPAFGQNTDDDIQCLIFHCRLPGRPAALSWVPRVSVPGAFLRPAGGSFALKI